jgi:hypothetical protein
MHDFAPPDSLACPPDGPHPPHTSAAWRDYFRTNAESLLEIPWEWGVTLSDAERHAIATSVQEFQLGESSEGKHLMTRAIHHAADTGDVAFIPALRLFIAEEHRHARDLGRVMDLAGIPRVGRTWPDTVFRWLRRGAGLELSVAVLITAEIIAKVYYLALRQATHSPVLRRLCVQILNDEAQHVRFQAERVAILRRGRSRLSLALRRGVHQGFLVGTCLVVWQRHRRAFRAGRYSFTRFWSHTWMEMGEVLRRMDPASYAWPAAGPVGRIAANAPTAKAAPTS